MRHKRPDCEVEIQFIFGVGQTVVTAPEEQSEEELVLPDIGHVGRPPDPVSQLLYVSLNRLFVLFKHLPAVLLQFLITKYVDMILHQHYPQLLLTKGC